MASQTASRLAAQILEALRASPDAAQLWNSVSSSVQSPISPGPDPADVVLSDSENCLTLFLGNLEYALFPHARRPILASSFGIDTRDIAWTRVAMQIKNNAMDENWMRSQSLAKISDIFARACTMAGNCCSPLYFPKTKAEELFDIWRLMNEQRMERYEWSFSGHNNEEDSLRPSVALFRGIAGRNPSRPRRRFLRGRCINYGDNLVVREDDVQHVEPSEDGGNPAERQDVPLDLSTYFSLPLSSLNPFLTVQSAKRPGGALESGSAKGPRTERAQPQQHVHPGSTKGPPTENGKQRGVNMEDYGSLPSDDHGVRLALVPQDIQNATHLSAAGWPSLWDLCGRAPPAPL